VQLAEAWDQRALFRHDLRASALFLGLGAAVMYCFDRPTGANYWFMAGPGVDSPFLGVWARIDRSFLGVPVTAVGVPTVIDAAHLGEGEALRGLFVTPRDIDSAVRSCARIIAYGVNLALHPRLTVEDIDGLVG